MRAVKTARSRLSITTIGTGRRSLRKAELNGKQETPQMTDEEYEDYLYNMVETGEMSLSEYLRIEEDMRWEDYQYEQWLKNKKAKEDEINTEQS